MFLLLNSKPITGSFGTARGKLKSFFKNSDMFVREC